MDKIVIPPGYVLRKIGGRPKNTARNVAVLIARYWRTSYWCEPAKVADEWIIDRWTNDGINDDAHVRRAIRNARADLKDMTIIFSNQHAAALTLPFAEGALGWLWAEPLKVAYPVELKNLDAKLIQDSLKLNHYPASNRVVPRLG